MKRSSRFINPKIVGLETLDGFGARRGLSPQFATARKPASISWQRCRIIIAAISCGAICGVLSSYHPLIQSMEEQCISFRMRLLSLRHRDLAARSQSRIVLAPITENTFSQAGLSSTGAARLPRAYYAKVLRELQWAGAKVVVFDLLFDEPRKGDAALASAAQAFGRVVWGCAWQGGQGSRWLVPNAQLIKASPYLGHTRVKQQGAAAVDRFEGVIEDQGRTVPALSVAAARLALAGNVPPLVRRQTGLECGPIIIPLEADNSFRFSYLAGERGLPKVPIEQIYSGAANDPFYRKSHFFKDKIVVIGDAAAISHDIYATPIGHLPGYEVHAHAIASLLQRSFLFSPNPLVLVLTYLLVPTGCAIATFFRRWTLATTLCLLWAAAYSVFCLWAFVDTGLVFPVAGPLCAALLAGCCGLVERGRSQERNEARLEAVASQYVSTQVHEFGPPIGEVTLLFTDIEGSTRLSASLTKKFERARDEHFRLLREATKVWNGFEVETAGDSLFVVFSSPIDAVHCSALGQQLMAAHPWPEIPGGLRVRMGLNTGTPFVGRDRMRLTYRGPVTNCAAAVMGAAQGGQVLLTTSTQSAIQSALLQLGCDIADLAPLSFQPHGRHVLKTGQEITLIELNWCVTEPQHRGKSSPTNC